MLPVTIVYQSGLRRISSMQGIWPHAETSFCHTATALHYAVTAVALSIQYCPGNCASCHPN